MQEEHTTKAALLASVCPELHFAKAFDHIDLALDLTNVLGLALRAPDYHTESLVASMAELADAAAELLKAARESIVDEDFARRKAPAGEGENAH